MIDVVRADIGHAQIIAEVGARSFKDAFAESNKREDIELYLLQKFSLENITRELNDINARFFLSFYDGEPVGYAKLINSMLPDQIKDISAIEMQRIYVIKEFYNMKVGKQLMMSCLKLAEEAGFDAVWLGVWQKNQRAIDFYKKWEFEIFGTRNFQLGSVLNDDYLMIKKIRQ